MSIHIILIIPVGQPSGEVEGSQRLPSQHGVKPGRKINGIAMAYAQQSVTKIIIPGMGQIGIIKGNPGICFNIFHQFKNGRCCIKRKIIQVKQAVVLISNVIMVAPVILYDEKAVSNVVPGDPVVRMGKGKKQIQQGSGNDKIPL